MTLSLDRLRDVGEALYADESREKCLAWSGLKATADLRAVHARHAEASSEAAIDLARQHYLACMGSSQEASARMLLEWQVATLCARRMASLLEREGRWQGEATIPGPDGEVVPYHEFGRALMELKSRAAREALYAARALVIEHGLAPIRQEQVAIQRGVVESLGLGLDWKATWELLSGVDLSLLARQARAFLDASTEQYRRLWQEHAGGEVTSQSASWIDVENLVRGEVFDGGFPASTMMAAVEGSLGAMGLEWRANGRISIDDVPRPSKNPVAMCFSIRVPHEVAIVTKPIGGHWDWSVLLHEVGHALHYARTEASLPFEYRRLGDESVDEGCAFLFQSLMSDGRWLRRFSELDAASVSRYRRFDAFMRLFFVRRYCAAVLYEIEVVTGALDWNDLPLLYSRVMTEATGFRYRSAGAYTDLDWKILYRVNYLRGWQLQALVAEELARRFGDAWWETPRAAEWLESEIWCRGRTESADALAARLTGSSLSFDPLLRSFEA